MHPQCAASLPELVTHCSCGLPMQERQRLGWPGAVTGFPTTPGEDQSGPNVGHHHPHHRPSARQLHRHFGLGGKTLVNGEGASNDPLHHPNVGGIYKYTHNNARRCARPLPINAPSRGRLVTNTAFRNHRQKRMISWAEHSPPAN